MKERIKKIRVDELLAKNTLVGTRSKAKALIIAGEISYKEQRVTKPSQLVPEDAELVIKEPQKYVGRGGYKLEKALEVFDLTPNRLIGIDVGASTGGFTDCMLQNGAHKVYCVDVGYGQLATSLVNDDRVIQKDRTNARNLTSDDFPEAPECAVVDCSFISGDKVIKPLKSILNKPGWIVWLLKPQFEAGPKKVGKGGVIRKLDVLRDAIEDALTRIVSIGGVIRNATHSPITGTDGNHEFLVHLDFNDKKPGANLLDVIEELLQGLNLRQ